MELLWTDLSGKGNNGTLNGPTFNSGNSGSIVFDGSNDTISLGTQINSDITETDITVSFWTYLDSTSGDRALWRYEFSSYWCSINHLA